jgi:hypothetical protein
MGGFEARWLPRSFVDARDEGKAGEGWWSGREGKNDQGVAVNRCCLRNTRCKILPHDTLTGLVPFLERSRSVN